MIQGSKAQIELLTKIAKDFGYSLSDFEKRHFRKAVDAKRVAYYTLRLCGLSTVQIGYVMNKDHSSVLNGLSKIRHYEDLVDKASSYFLWFKENYPDSVKPDRLRLRNTCLEMREQIKKCLNEGITDAGEIAEKNKA